MQSNQDTADSTGIEQAREKINDVDRRLIELLRERVEAAQAIGQHKVRAPGTELFDSERENAVERAWAEQAKELGLPGYFTGRILREVLNLSRRSQEPMWTEANGTDAGTRTVRVAYQGAPSSYSDLAIDKLFAHRPHGELTKTGYGTFGEAVEALTEGDADYALLPVENTLVGSISEVNNLLVRSQLSIVDEEDWDPEHCLVGLPGTSIQQIREVRSHAVALQQCGKAIASLGGAHPVEYFDTAGAAASVREADDPTIACICSMNAAQAYGLEVLRRDIADRRQNITRFLLLAREPEDCAPSLPAKTTIAFSADDRCGALVECLSVFNDLGVNMTRLESRPQPDAPWEYVFLADLDGHQSTEPTREALDRLKRCANHVRVLGSYTSRVTERREVGMPTIEPPAAAATVDTAPAAPPKEKVETTTQPAGAKTQPLHAIGDDGERRPVRVRGIDIGAETFTLILGPCAVENRQQVHDAAAMAKHHGARMLRGGAFKPRSSPYSFQGLGWEGLDLLAEAGQQYELPIVTEVLEPDDVERVAETADMLQIGARNMQNFALLKAVGKTRRPVLLKRGMSATVSELLQAAEYVMAGGNQRVVLCERGIRTFERATRNTLDVSAVPVLKDKTHLPVIVDPSHAAGLRHLVVPLALAAAAAGADGLIVECHPRPEEALCDKDQALTERELGQMLAGLEPILQSNGRRL